MPPEIEQIAKVIAETRQAALNHLSVTDPYRAGFLGASSRIAHEISKSFSSDVRTQFLKAAGF